MPSHGDFLTRRLPRGFTDPWDRWLQSAVADSREQLGEDWLDIYLTSPIWRFALSTGLCGETAWCGILMPSVDRVGRYFPLTVAVPLEPGGNLTALLQDDAEWFSRCEELALASLAEEIPLEDFDLALTDLSPPEIPPHPGAVTSNSMGRAAWQFELPSLESTFPVSAALNQTLLKRAFPAYSLWWSEGSERVRPSLLVTEGLPPIQGFAALLDGNWVNWNWSQYRVHLPPSPIPESGNGSEQETGKPAETESK
ncbi:MAG: type VI secretion system-associated protein TagF [gamma proteobacterium endosymbiont of Lamellibrachia anaximandri]|nr:type VI secretion system-associated protein TagF [gamma proteobacterium endosymbiont of Lamellibrachia anaximandri]